MVWCAREADNYPLSEAMLCHWHYGWIHWDEATKSWHSVTSLQLSMPVIDEPKVNGHAPKVPQRVPIKPLESETIEPMMVHRLRPIQYADVPIQEGPHPHDAQHTQPRTRHRPRRTVPERTRDNLHASLEEALSCTRHRLPREIQTRRSNLLRIHNHAASQSHETTARSAGLRALGRPLHKYTEEANALTSADEYVRVAVPLVRPASVSAAPR